MPTIELPRKLERVLTTKARLVVILGGRSSGKSEGIGRVMLMKCQAEQADVLCGREYMNSIDDSVHKLLLEITEKTGAKGFNITDKKIDCEGGKIRFKGFARNSSAVKSAQGFKYSWIEEADVLSQKSIDDLLPTIRANNSKLFFTANPQSSEDPFSKRFIVPFKDALDTHGFYEDDMHLVIMINWRDNPWHGELESQRLWDYENLPRAKYDHIWEGAFLDSVESPLIKPEWFDACIDAHKKLGFEPLGVKMASHDPSDEGADSKGYAYRHGSVVLDVREMTTGNINDGGDWALGLATQQRVDAYTWDCDGMGVGLNRQTEKAFKGKQCSVAQYRGSESVDFPEAVYMPAEGVQHQRTNKQSFKNKRAQYYFLLRDRIHRTYLAVEKGQYHDPDTLISFCSSIELLTKLRSELCRMPIKPNSNGLFELYTKQEMKTKFKINSPNLADSVKMLFRLPTVQAHNVVMPAPIRPMGGR